MTAISFGWLITSSAGASPSWWPARSVSLAGGMVKWYQHPSKAPWLSAAELAEITADADAASARTPAVPAMGFAGLVRSHTMWAIGLSHGFAVHATYFFLTWLPT